MKNSAKKYIPNRMGKTSSCFYLPWVLSTWKNYSQIQQAMNLKCNSCSKIATHRTQLLQTKNIWQGCLFFFFPLLCRRRGKKRKAKFKKPLYPKDYSCPLLSAPNMKLSQEKECYNIPFLKSRSPQLDCHNQVF